MRPAPLRHFFRPRLAPGMERLLPTVFTAGGAYTGAFHDVITKTFLAQPGVQRVTLPALGLHCWLLPLADGTKLHVYEERVDDTNFACDCCRIVGAWGRGQSARHLCGPDRPRPRPAAGWQCHPVSLQRWHFIVPAEVRPQPRGRGCGGDRPAPGRPPRPPRRRGSTR